MAGKCILAGMVAFWALSGIAMADAPDKSLRPMPRPMVEKPSPVAVAVASPALESVAVPSLRPRARPFVAVAPAAQPVAMAQPAAVAFGNGLDRSLRPRLRPGFVQPATPAPQAQPEQTAVATAAPVTAAPAPRRGGLFGFLAPRQRPAEDAGAQDAAVRIEPGREAVVSKKGSVCGINAVKGETLAPIPAKMEGCGIKEPVRVTSVGGIALSTPATINCTTAEALYSWVRNAVEPVYGKGKVVELKVAASYACRPRNNIRGAKVSEHGRGNAIDIAGITLSNGKTYMVRSDFDKKMRQVHKAACGIFGTTLGPGSDGYHEDHLHFDVASQRNGPYCR